MRRLGRTRWVSVDGWRFATGWDVDVFQGRQLDEQQNSRTAMFLAVLKLHMHAMHAKNKYSLLQCLGSNQQCFFLKKWSDILSGMYSNSMLAMKLRKSKSCLTCLTTESTNEWANAQKIQSCRHCLSTNWTFVKLSDNEPPSIPRMPIPLGFRSRRFWDEVISGPVGVVLSTPSVSTGRKARSCGCHEKSNHSHVAVLRCWHPRFRWQYIWIFGYSRVVCGAVVLS